MINSQEKVCSLCHSSKAPLHDEGGDLVLHLPSLGILHGSLGEHCEDLSQTSIADKRKKKDIRLGKTQAQLLAVTLCYWTHCTMLPPCGESKTFWLCALLLRPHLIQILLPLRVKYCPQGDWTAVVLMEAASEPLAGSVRQKAAICSPGGTNTHTCSVKHAQQKWFSSSIFLLH